MLSRAQTKSVTVPALGSPPIAVQLNFELTPELNPQLIYNADRIANFFA